MHICHFPISLFCFLVGQAPTNVKVEVTGNDSLTVNWDDPQKPLGEIKHYLIKITVEGETHKDVTVLPDPSNRPVTVSPLTPFKAYSIQVVTVNQQLNEQGGGPGEPTVAVNATTWPARMFKEKWNKPFTQKLNFTHSSVL